eukprot:gene13979-14096_t
MAADYGADSSLAMGWLTPADQIIRFNIMAGIADFNGKTVLDAGCGYGDLLPYLAGNYMLRQYIGVEQIPELLARAMRSFGHLPYTTFICADFLTDDLPAADFVLASGSLNYAGSSPGFIYQAISALFNKCTTGLAFNLLRSVPENDLLVAYEPKAIFSYCKSQTEKVELIADYADEDFTVFMFH